MKFINKKHILLIFLIMGIIVVNTVFADNLTSKSGSQIKWHVISSGGTDGSSFSYELKGTVSQTSADKGSSSSYGLSHGFWQGSASPSGPCQGICGDANEDQSVDVSDAVYIINFVFIGGGAPKPVKACGDANSDASVDISDAVYIINFIFIGGSAPTDCSPGGPEWIDGDCCEFITREGFK